ncbi:MAG: DUF2027 domain-containing protein [Bacteroidetes bacterium]|nr:DUF2027 domain-containing protein [Bacteroidota bacterium]
MKFSQGDKVKFLNTSGGGIVTKIISTTMVSVAIEEGFEVPTLVTELIKIDESSAGARLFNKDFNVNPKFTQEENEIEEDDGKSALQKSYGNSNQAAGVYLAFVPHDQRWLLTGNLDVCLINHTEYYTLFNFTLFKDDGKFYGMDYDVMEAESKKIITTIEREDLEDWSSGNVQILFHAETKDRLLTPLNADFKIKPSRFYKEENYIVSSFLREKALLLTLGNLIEIPVNQSRFYKAADKSTPEIQLKKSSQLKSETILDSHQINPTTAEIDLHIGELVEDYYLLDNAEMLKIQLDYFVKCLESAFVNKTQKLIFIHGVGNGVLKNEMIKILKTYDNLHYFDASMAKYGAGATEVYIR